LCVGFGEGFDLERLVEEPVGFGNLFTSYFILHNS